MKILFCPAHVMYDEYRGGSEAGWAYTICNSIASKYPSSVVITGYINLLSKKVYFIKELQKGKNKLDLSIKNALFFNIQYSLELIRQVKNDSFSLIHHVLPFLIGTTFSLPIILKKIIGIKYPIVIGPIQSPLKVRDADVNSSDLRNYSGIKKPSLFLASSVNILRPILNFLSVQTLKRANAVVAIDKRTKKLLIELGVPANIIFIIPPGIDSSKFRTTYKKKMRSSLSLITVGYLIERKRVDLVIKAIKELKKINSNYKVNLTIVGDGPQLKILKKMVKDYKLHNSITFTGFINNNDVFKYYQQADIFVSMSGNESWGQMYLEAMACELPIITTRNEGATQILDNKFSFFVDDNERALASRIKEIISKRNLLIRMGVEARNEIVKNYDWKNVIIPKYLKIYQGLINEKG